MPRYLDKRESKEKAESRVRQSEAIQRVEYLESEQNAEEDTQKLVAIRTALGQIDDLNAHQMRFLVAYAIGQTLAEACAITSTSYQAHYKWLQQSEYRIAFENAKQYIADEIEKTVFKLAMGRLMKPIVNQGKIVTYERIYDAKLLAMLVRAYKPDRYKDRVDITTNGSSIVKIVDRDAWESI